MEVTSGKRQQSGITQDNGSEIIKRANHAEDRKKAESVSRETTPAQARQDAIRHAKSTIGRYLNAKA
ncbi:MAG: hypothetical protein QM760_14135 [Nibricoccus sp.]